MFKIVKIAKSVPLPRGLQHVRQERAREPPPRVGHRRARGADVGGGHVPHPRRARRRDGAAARVAGVRERRHAAQPRDGRVRGDVRGVGRRGGRHVRPAAAGGAGWVFSLQIMYASGTPLAYAHVESSSSRRSGCRLIQYFH